ncbi:MAG: hypothetical protein KatS3mg110_0977 [Pirellulaceae bacterium]|nr:MAG: hypothetical protein KatS3mg110_0977 [Pirellulaceae bacterium]
MKRQWAHVLVLAGLGVLWADVSPAAERPNFLVLVSDDQRWDTLGAAGNAVIQTPHLDRLAREGVYFENSFCTTSICAVSRASFFSGQYARRHGIWDFATPFSPEAWKQTYPMLLKAHGYQIGFIGKWGVGNRLPREDFDYWDGFPGQGRYYEREGGEHLTKRQGDSAVRFLETIDPKRPFCLQISFKAAHCQDGAAWQFQYDLRHKHWYADSYIPPPPTADDAHFSQLPPFLQESEARKRWTIRFANPEMYQNTVKDYYRLISGMDEVIGILIDKLASMDVLKNTVIIFTSDNGFYLGDYGLAGKWFMHEPSIRVPLIIWDGREGQIKAGHRPAELVLNIDVAPTILELAGIPLPESMQGTSLVPLCQGKKVAWRQDFLYEHLFEHPRIPKSEGVRGTRYKYTRYLVGERPYEVLVDLKEDPWEEKNLVHDPEHRPVLETMRRRCDELVAACGPEQPEQARRQKGTKAPDGRFLAYPESPKVDQVDNYHGVSVADPYRWLEDLDSEQTRRWVEEQNRVTFAYLEAIPQREALIKRLTELWNFERFGLPVKRGGKYFYTRNDGLQNQSVLYVAEALDAPPRLLLDPNKLSEDGTVALRDWVPSHDGRYVALGLASAGSDWQEWRVLETESGQLLPDHIQWVKFSSVSWTADNQGFFYSRYDEPKPGEELTGVNYYQKVFYHKLGDPQGNDQLIYHRPDQKEWGFAARTTEDGRYLTLHVWRGTENKNQIFYKDLSDAGSDVVELISGFDWEYEFLGNIGDTFYVMTDREAPKRRIMAVKLEQPQFEHWQEIVPESQDVLRGAALVGGKLVAAYLHDAYSRVRIFEPDGTWVRDVEFPGIGTVSGFDGRWDDPETFYDFTTFTRPSTIYRYNVVTGESQIFREPKLKFRPDDFETRQVFYTSKDGTRVPMFLTYRKGWKPDGQTPTLLYGYGGFDISLTPGFSVMNLVWVEMGGLYAQPNLRGGGEYGREWHEAGMLDKKQNVFDDFIAAAEWLIQNGYTRPERLAIRGGSNGGLLVGAVMTQRPELFGAALPAVGVMDMLRYHRFTIGWAWVSEYGSSDDPQQFRTLIRYSPLHNLRPGVRYPSTLVTTADHDDRVVPAHSFKFAAALQEAHAGTNPVLIRIETRAGHGAGTPTAKRIQQEADMLAFLIHELRWDVSLPQQPESKP